MACLHCTLVVSHAPRTFKSYYLIQKVIFLFQSLLVFIVPLTYNFTHSGLRLYLYNEDDFYLSVLISDKLFRN